MTAGGQYSPPEASALDRTDRFPGSAKPPDSTQGRGAIGVATADRPARPVPGPSQGALRSDRGRVCGRLRAASPPQTGSTENPRRTSCRACACSWSPSIARYHGIVDEGAPFREIAAVIGASICRSAARHPRSGPSFRLVHAFRGDRQFLLG